VDAAEVKNFIKNSDSLGTIPVVLGKILSLVGREDSSLEELNGVIAHDQALAERVIQVANSPLFGRSGRIRDIRQAVMFLGFGRIKAIAVGMKVIDIFPPDRSFDVRNIWIHGYEVASIASVLSEFIIMTSPRECFLSGLLHDIGRIIFYQIDHRRFYSLSTTDDMLDKELSFFGCTHAEAGAWFGEAAGMPAEIIQTTKYHHSPSLAESYRDSVSIVSLAEALSRMFSPRIEDDGLWTQEHDALLLELGIKSAELAAIGAKLFGSRKEAERFFDS
jgi:HD-like signal output (HDOD) protein